MCNGIDSFEEPEFYDFCVPVKATESDSMFVGCQVLSGKFRVERLWIGREGRCQFGMPVSCFLLLLIRRHDDD